MTLPVSLDAGSSAADLRSLHKSLGLEESALLDVRAAGQLLHPHIDDLIEDFYRWLSPLPEFARFFGTDAALLGRVKSHQTAYWRDFLRAEVDEQYIERRRIVGHAHARIELGLLIYLRAMEYVSTWLIQRVEADEALLCERPAVAFSIRKLIHFDSTIVVHTYAAQTAQLLEAQRSRLERVASVMRAVTEGDLEHLVEVAGPGDVLGSSVNDMVKSLKSISTEMKTIAQGNYSADVAPRSEKDVLGVSLQAMTRALREAASSNERHLWMTTSLAQLREAMSGNPSVRELSRGVVGYLCRVLEAQVGTLYAVDAGSDVLRLAGTYAAAEGKGVPTTFQLGEGLVGQAALERRPIVVSHMPEDCIRVRWGLGEAIPKTLVVVPLLHETEVRGVVEIGSFSQLSDHHLQFLDRAAPSIGLALASAETRARVEQLLQESQAQAQELTSQQEELRSVNERLAEQTHALELQKENLLATETVLRQKAAELERASRYKSEFLANMSHELRTPLNSSLILAKLLIDNKEGNLSAEQVRYARSIYSAGNDLLQLINDILDLSKIEAGKVEVTIETVGIDGLLGQLKHRFDPLTADKDLEIYVTAEPGCPETLETDHLRLQQILTNLLANAVKFTEKGSVHLRAARSEEGLVAFTVEDTGIGIPAEQHEAVFGAFRQADGTTSRKYGGTGLGLSICRELAELLGGQIQLRSAPGQGSTFTVLLPREYGKIDAARSAPPKLALPPKPPPAPAVPTPPAPATRPYVEDDRNAITDPQRVILIVEDDPMFAEIVRDLSHELGFQCLVAGSAGEAIALAREHRPVGAILDIGLPDGSGLTVLEVLKRDPKTRHVPVHVVSVHDHRQLAGELGAIGYALKPLDRDKLSGVFQVIEERISRTLRSVLVVEDDHVQRKAITRLLASDPVRVVAVASASEALAELQEKTFDCIVLDLMMPDVNGFELLDRMASDSRRPLPPVIVYTARMLDADEEHKLRKHSKSIIIKGARSPERLLEEVTLFLHQVESELPPEKQHMLKRARDREPVFDSRRVLLVEDDVRNIFALTSLLEREGIVLDIARNGLEALARLHNPPAIDLILMDVMMPEMDGLTATRTIRKGNGQGPSSIPIIALTAKAMPDDRDQCLAAGANDYIAKPVDADKLLSLLRIWMPR